MDIILLTIGKTNIEYVAAGISEYKKRLTRYVPYNIIEIPDIKNTRGLSEEQQKDKEGDLIINSLNQSDFVVLLDERGKEYTSEEFAYYMEKQMSSGKKRIVFVVGGPYGFSEKVYQRADSKISLSRMTFNHEMVRLFFTEQIYRAMTILKGEPYHHK